MLKIENLSKSFGQKQVLKSIDLELPEAKCHILLGPSGCGKSTLLKLIMGLIPPTQGRVLVGGTEVNEQSSYAIRKKIGYVLQHAGLFPHMTAQKNLELVARLNGWDVKRARERTEELSELVGLHISLMDKFPQNLSGGQRQRVGLMRALFLDPPILLFDEALSALDPLIRRELQTELRQIFDRLNKTVVFVTHDVAEAIIVGDSITLLRQGEVAQHGPVEEIFKSPKNDYVKTFLSAQKPPSLMEAVH